MYKCSNCHREYKRLPRGLMAYSGATFLLCRRCKDIRIQRRDNDFFINAVGIRHLKEQGTDVTDVTATRSYYSGLYGNWIWYTVLCDNRQVRSLLPALDAQMAEYDSYETEEEYEYEDDRDQCFADEDW